MRRNHYEGMRPGDLEGKPYARFWQPQMALLPPEVADALRHGEQVRGHGIELSEAGKLLAPGYLPLENGFTRLANGQILVAVRTDMPGCTGAMFEWWMGWHCVESQRYKLWHPRAHVANATREMWGDDPSLSDREKYMTTHYVPEYIGDRLYKVRITFVDPRELLGEGVDLAAGGTTALVCGRVDLQQVPIHLGWLIHQIREHEGATEMRSRFWIGKPEVSRSSEGDFRDGVLGAAWFRRLVVPSDLGRQMVVHCAMEMNHLARFLPELYALYHADTAPSPTRGRRETLSDSPPE